MNSKKQPKQETKEIAPYGYNGFKTEIRMNRSMQHYIDQCFGYARRCWNRMAAEYNLEKDSKKGTDEKVKINDVFMARVHNDGKEEDWELAMPGHIWNERENTLKKTIARFGKANFKSKRKAKQSFSMTYQKLRGSKKKKEYLFKRGRKHQYFRFVMGAACEIPNDWRWIQLREDIDFDFEGGDEIKNVTITKDGTKYFASFQIKLGYPRKETEGKGSVGIDPGLHTLMTLSDGTTYNFTDSVKAKLARLDKKQRFLDKKMSKIRNRNKNWKKSRHYAKVKTKRQRICFKIKMIRKDNLHRMTTEIVRKYKYVYWEDVKSKNMVKNHKLAKAIYGASWGTIKIMLQVKCKMHNGQLYLVPTTYAATQRCSYCGRVKKGNEKLNLSDRVYVCPECGHKEDRDLNAAKSIAKYTQQ